MSYQPLARKYRPSGFADLVGQDAVAQALANGIRLKREPHAVIFSGVRGIGKTTAARLYAKALNCDQGPTPEPCGSCSSCLAIASCTHEDVMEIDGASNTSVDDVRQIRETVDYVPQRSRYKVYIIDEVHMLSNSAFNALLKTLEEPPAHVVFMFATTELQKIPQTIVGRCQTFYLKKFSVEQIAGRLRFVLNSENIIADDRVITEIAKRGNGSMRDALTFLDTAIAVSCGELTHEKLSDLLNIVSSDTLIDLIRSLLNRDSVKGLELIDRLDQQGVDFAELCEQLAELVRHAFVLREIGDDPKLMSRLTLEEGLVTALKALGKNAHLLDLNRLFRVLVQCRTELDGSSLDRFVFENCCLEWCLDPGLPDIQSIRSSMVHAKQNAEPVAKIKSPALVLDPTPSAPNPPVAPEQRKDLRTSWLNTTSKPNTAEALPPDLSAQTNPPAPGLASASVSDAPALSLRFPSSWRELVDEWQKKKPLQARIFEETYSIAFSESLISIGVNRDSLAGMKLLNRDVQAKVAQQMQELFGFNGQFLVLDRQGAEASPQSRVNPADESVLEAKRKEKDLRREELRNELENSPSTKSILEVFGGRIESIEVTDPNDMKNGIH